MNRPALATAGTVLAILLLIGAKDATSPQPLELSGGSSTSASGSSGSSTGPVVMTQYGPVQVEVVVVGGRITEVKALRLPTGGQSGSIADYSAPILRREALAAQGAGIQAVSGATYTSQGYARSLQAALDQLSSSSKARSTSSARSAPAAGARS